MRPKKRSILVRLPNSSRVQVGGRQARFLVHLGFGGHHGDSAEDSVDPVDQGKTPLARIQADDPGAQTIEAHSPTEEGLGKGGVMRMGRTE